MSGLHGYIPCRIYSHIYKRGSCQMASNVKSEFNDETKVNLKRLTALTRSNVDTSAVSKCIEALESSFHLEPQHQQLILGTWELLFSNDDPTRASPFFWAFKKAFKGFDDPFQLLGPKSLAESIFLVTDSIPLKEIGFCRQTITATPGDQNSGTFVSQVEVKANIFGSSKMTTSCNWHVTNEPNLLELQVLKTQVLDSTIGKLLPILDSDRAFPSGAALELFRFGAMRIRQNFHTCSHSISNSYAIPIFIVCSPHVLGLGRAPYT